MRRECHSGAGTARYDSASRNSSGSRDVGEPDLAGSESESESKALEVLVELERKFKRGVKSYRRFRSEWRSFSSSNRRLELEVDRNASSWVQEVDVATAETGGWKI